ncbi:MAG: SCP2 sterol-binding domain-containing protein [Lachnospiraceae bacterium]|nr:SCP2 sterol-binding domain-containing protein [Lachnospiraceae bacterium]
MNINIYYGGRGIIDDPTLFVLNKMQEVLEELNVKVTRYNLHESKGTITTLPQTLKDADGIILATTIEWYGIGGYMQQFLDACWLYGDKEKIAQIYMCPIVMSTTYGEREGKMHLSNAWEVLGGLPCSGICGYVADNVKLEMNPQYVTIIEKKAENMYRTINQKVPSFPASNLVVKQMVSITPNFDFTPQETEQLSMYASDAMYVQRQKEDIQELANLFKDMMADKASDEEAYIKEFRNAFKPQPGVSAFFSFKMDGKSPALLVKVNGSRLVCEYGDGDSADVVVMLDRNVLEDLLVGRMTFQRAFMSGAMKIKGEFNVFRALDQLFVFS